jgi:hypothetical protein
MDVVQLPDRVRVFQYVEYNTEYEMKCKELLNKYEKGFVSEKDIIEEIIRVKEQSHELNILAHVVLISRYHTCKMIEELLNTNYDIKTFGWDGNNFLMFEADYFYTLSQDINSGFVLEMIQPKFDVTEQLRVMNYLIESELFDLNQKNDVGESLVHFLAGSELCYDIFERLVKERKIDITDVARNNLTTLYYARKTGNKKAEDLLQSMI